MKLAFAHVYGVAVVVGEGAPLVFKIISWRRKGVETVYVPPWQYSHEFF